MQPQDPLMHHSIRELKLRLLWPKKGQTVNALFYFKYFVALVVACPVWLFLLLHLIKALQENWNISLSADISILSSLAGLHIMLIMFIWGQKKISFLFRALVDFSEFGKPDNYDATVSKLNLYSKMYSAYCTIGIFTYAILKQLEIPECKRLNQEKNLNEYCGLFVSVWFPWNLNFSPMNYLILLNQFFSVFLIINAGAVVSFTTYEIAVVLVLKMKHLGRLLREALEHPDHRVKAMLLKHCFRYHQHIIKLQDLFDGRYRYCNGTYVMMVGVIIAGLFNQYIKENNLGALLHMGGWIFSFFICCHAGQMIISESLEVANYAYNSEWYKAPINIQKDLLIFLVRVQQRLELHASPIGIMSYQLYITIVKTSYSYFALLNQTT